MSTKAATSQALQTCRAALKCSPENSSLLLIPKHNVLAGKKAKIMQRGISTHDHCHYWQFSTLMLWGIGANELRCEARTTSLPVFQTAPVPKYKMDRQACLIQTTSPCVTSGSCSSNTQALGFFSFLIRTCLHSLEISLAESLANNKTGNEWEDSMKFNAIS